MLFRSLAIALTCSGLLSSLSACSSSASAIQPGGVYTYQGGDGTWGLLKVQSLGDGLVDVRLYRNRFPTAPSSIDPQQLQGPEQTEQLSEAGFANWQPRLLSRP